MNIIEIINGKDFITSKKAKELVKFFSDTLCIELSDKIIEIVFVDSTEIKKLNKVYLNKDFATDVLSFHVEQISTPIGIYGTIVISPADANGSSRSIEQLIIHGLLHLSGYDHDRAPNKWRNAAKRLNHHMG